MLNAKIADLKMQTTLTPAEDEQTESNQSEDDAKKKVTP